MVDVLTLPTLAGLDGECVRLARLLKNVIGLASKPANRLMKMHDVLYVLDRLPCCLMDARKSVLRIRIGSGSRRAKTTHKNSKKFRYLMFI
jgi:hypothetical protein